METVGSKGWAVGKRLEADTEEAEVEVDEGCTVEGGGRRDPAAAEGNSREVGPIKTSRYMPSVATGPPCLFPQHCVPQEWGRWRCCGRFCGSKHIHRPC